MIGVQIQNEYNCLFFRVNNDKYILQPFNLVADFGGQVGLWLGLSMVTLFEFFELVMDLILVTYRWCRKKRASFRKTSDLAAVENEKNEMKSESVLGSNGCILSVGHN